VQIDERGLASGHGISKGHAGSNAFMEAQNVFEIRRHVAKKGQFRRSGIAKDHGHPQFAQELIGDFSNGTQRLAPDFLRTGQKTQELYHFGPPLSSNSLSDRCDGFPSFANENTGLSM